MHKTLMAALFGTGLLSGAIAIHAAPPQSPHGPHSRPAGAFHGPGHMPPDDCPLAGHGPGGGFVRLMHKALDALDLSEAQREAVHETLLGRRAEVAAAVKPVVEARRALLNAVLADSPDDGAVRTAAAELGTALGDAAVVFARVRAEAFTNAQLTPAQQQKFATFRANVDSAIDEVLNERLPALMEAHGAEGG